MQLTAMTVRINNMARKAKTHHTELAMIVVTLEMKVIVHFHLPFIRMKMVITLKPKMVRCCISFILDVIISAL